MQMQPETELDTLACKHNDIAPGQESLQPSRSFTLFPELPIELRFKVRHWSFPDPAEVYIGVTEIFLRSRQGPLRFPISLWIHQESRRETLKHYCLFDRSRIPGQEVFRPEPLCFHPRRDIICIRYRDMFPNLEEGDDVELLKRNLSALSSDVSDHMDKIQHLHVTGFIIRDDLDCVQWLFNLSRGEDGAPRQAYLGAYNWAIFHFPVLRKIILHVIWHQPSDEICMPHYISSVKQFVEAHSNKFHGGNAPEVVGIYDFGVPIDT